MTQNRSAPPLSRPVSLPSTTTISRFPPTPFSFSTANNPLTTTAMSSAAPHPIWSAFNHKMASALTGYLLEPERIVSATKPELWQAVATAFPVLVSPVPPQPLVWFSLAKCLRLSLALRSSTGGGVQRPRVFHAIPAPSPFHTAKARRGPFHLVGARADGRASSIFFLPSPLTKPNALYRNPASHRWTRGSRSLSLPHPSSKPSPTR